jgi:L-alanine-DL-glutamate epimerase-like enolase superfamily enzyme
MKITKIAVYQVDLPIEGGHRISGGRSFTTLDDTVVIIETDEGISGIGEGCPLGTAYLPAFPGGMRAGIELIAPSLLGQDPRQLNRINVLMDKTLMGHPYVKSPIDMACWDILGKWSRLPVCELLGGRMTARLPFRAPIPVDDTPAKALKSLEERRAGGYFCYNIKVGNDPKVDIERIKMLAQHLKPHERLFADANRGWSIDDAILVLRNVPLEYAIYFEQPCATFDECLALRRITQHFIVLDEQVDTTESLLRAWKAGLGEAVNLKVSRVGGISKLRLLRDICIEMGIRILVQDNWASGIGSAAVAHLAHSTPERWLLGIWGAGFNTTLETAHGAPVIEKGCMIASEEYGLGLEPNFKILGKPVTVYQ